jgi:hypothetical protein
VSKKDPVDSKRRRREVFRFEIDDPTDSLEELREAEAEEKLAAYRSEKDPDGAAAALDRLNAAKRAVDACFGQVTVQALPPRLQLVFEQEIAERDSQQEKAHLAAVKAAEEAGEDPPEPKVEEPSWDAASYEVRFIAACDVDGRSAERWAEILQPDGNWTLEDRHALLQTCYQANLRRVFDPQVLGKGWAAKGR